MAASVPVYLSPRRQHPAWIFLGAIRSLWVLALPLAAFLVTGGRTGAWSLSTVSALLVLVGVLHRTGAWWRYRYEVAEGQLRVRSGLVTVTDRIVPVTRLQAIDVSVTPLQHLFGVVSVRIETAAADVTLEAVSRTEVALLRRYLASDATTLAGEGDLIRRISPWELLMAGATSRRFGPALVLLFLVVRLANTATGGDVQMEVTVENGDQVLRLAAVLVVGAWFLAIASTALSSARFEVRRRGDRLLIGRGLLDRRHYSIPLARIAAVTIGEGLVRQPLARAAVRFTYAGQGKESVESGVLFPLLRRTEVRALLEAAVPACATAVEPVDLQRLPSRARRSYLLARVPPLLGLTAVATGAAAVAPGLDWWWGLLPLAAVPLGAAHGHLRVRDTGWAIDPAGRLVVRNGGWTRRTTIVPLRRLQHASVAQSRTQRQEELASFSAVVRRGVSGRVRLEQIEAADAFALLERLGAPPGVPTPVAGDGRADRPAVEPSVSSA